MLQNVIFAQSRPRVTVFAAISSRPVLEKLLDKFKMEKNIEVQVSYASSAVLAKQIQQGAKADIFISADQDWMQYLEGLNLVNPENIHSFLGNQLVLVSHQSDATAAFTDITILETLLISNDKIAIGDPQIVPLGRYTEQTLKNLELFDLVQARLVKALDAQATTKLIERKETRFGVVYLTDALANKNLKILFTFPAQIEQDIYLTEGVGNKTIAKFLHSVPVQVHDPIIYPLALLGGQPKAEAKALYEFLQEKSHRRLIEEQGFSIP